MARPKPTGWKARATWHGLSSPCRGDRGSPVAYSCARDLAAGGGRRTEGFLAEHVMPDFGFILII